MGANTTLKSPVHLVQRLRRLSSPVESPWPSSVADHFDLDYMGSAEFEFGALSTSKKALRALHPESWGDPKRIAAPSGQDAWFVGPPERVMLAEQLLAAGLSGAYGHHTEERLCIFEAYNQRPGAKVRYDTYIGWWAIDRAKDFAIFRELEDAKTFRGVLLAFARESP
jgi:hypothetical protein